MVTLTSRCDAGVTTSPPPDVLRWRSDIDADAKIGLNVEKTWIDSADVCDRGRKSSVEIFSENLPFEKADLLCSQLGGKLYYPAVGFSPSLFIVQAQLRLLQLGSLGSWDRLHVKLGRPKSKTCHSQEQDIH